MRIKHFVNENDMVGHVAKELKISWEDAEKLFEDLGGYQGYTLTFYAGSQPLNEFSRVVHGFMQANNLNALSLMQDD